MDITLVRGDLQLVRQDLPTQDGYFQTAVNVNLLEFHVNQTAEYFNSVLIQLASASKIGR